MLSTAGKSDVRFTPKEAKLIDLGEAPFANTPAGFGRFIVEYTDKWAKVIRASDIKPE